MSDFFNDFFYDGDDDDDLESDDGGNWVGGDGGDDGGDDGEPPWFGWEVTLYDNSQQPVSYTYQEWRELALQPLEFLEEYYNFHNLDILYQLDEQDLMSDADWAEWRADYAAING